MGIVGCVHEFRYVLVAEENIAACRDSIARETLLFTPHRIGMSNFFCLSAKALSGRKELLAKLSMNGAGNYTGKTVKPLSAILRNSAFQNFGD